MKDRQEVQHMSNMCDALGLILLLYATPVPLGIALVHTPHLCHDHLSNSDDF